MISKRDFLKGVVAAGIGSSGIPMAVSDNTSNQDNKKVSDYLQLMNGCVLTTLARVINSHRAPVWDTDIRNSIMADFFCLGLDSSRNYFPLHVMFSGEDLIRTRPMEIQKKITTCNGHEAIGLIVKMKDILFQDLKEDAIIIVSGSMFVGNHVFYPMDFQYQPLPYAYLEERYKPLFMDTERINNLKRTLSAYSWSKYYIPLAQEKII